MGRTILLFMLLPVTLFAQKAKVTKYTTPLAGTVILRDIEDKYQAAVYSIEAPSPDGDADKVRLMKAKEQSAELFPRVKARAARKASATLAPPKVEKGYEVDTTSGIPPDNDMAISKGGMGVSVINSRITVVDGNNGDMLLRKSLAFISLDVNLNDVMNDNRYDPKVQYDPDADRFICVILNGRDQYNYVLVGFSLSNDPAEGWAFYKFYGDYKNDSTWFDYPGVAMTKDELFITGNKIKYAEPWETGFTETVIYQINKKDGYDSAATLKYQIWDGIQYNGKSIRNLFPVRPGRGMQGPEQYFLSNRNFDVQNDSIFLVKVPDNMASNNSNLTLQLLQSPLKYGVPPNGRQPDTSVVLNTNDGRILGAYAMNGEIQFVSTSIVPADGSSGIFHGRIKNYDSTPELSYAYIHNETGLDLGYPNISYVGDSLGENYSIISFDYTGPAAHPGIGAIFSFNGEYSEMARVKEGDSSIQILLGKNQRWGDYTGTQVDFKDTSCVWISGLYGRTSNRYDYGTWMAKLKSPKATVYPVPTDTAVTSGVTRFYPNPVVEMVNYEFSMPEDGAVQFRIYGTDGRMVAEILNQQVKKGANVIQFNIGHLSRGIYFLKGVRSDGDVMIEQKFQKL